MYIRSLRARNFRNYAELNLSLTDGITVFIGENAQGKTNLLEAVYLLAIAKSPRTQYHRELIRWGSRELTLIAEVTKKMGTVNLQVNLSIDGTASYLIDGTPVRRTVDFVGTLNAVLFTPQELEIVQGPPSQRRRFLDIALSQLSPAYRHLLLQYNHVLSQRNALLKRLASKQAPLSTLSIWNEQLVQLGSELIVKRRAALERFAIKAAEAHQNITGGETLTIAYFSSLGPVPDDKSAMAESFLHQLTLKQEEEIQRGLTLTGPHRDDVVLRLNGNVDLRNYGSQGQKRTAALAMKLAEVDIFREELGEPPVLLLDDVFSELDIKRRQALVKLIRNGVQTLITATDPVDFDQLLLKERAYQIMAVKDGKVASRGDQCGHST